MLTLLPIFSGTHGNSNSLLLWLASMHLTADISRDCLLGLAFHEGHQGQPSVQYHGLNGSATQTVGTSRHQTQSCKLLFQQRQPTLTLSQAPHSVSGGGGCSLKPHPVNRFCW